MDCNELLQTSHTPEARHRPLSSSKGQVGIFSAIVEMPASFLATFAPNHLHGCSIRRASIRDDNMRITVSLHCFLDEFQRSSLISLLRDIGFQDFAFVVDWLRLPSADEDLVKVPPPLRASSHRL